MVDGLQVLQVVVEEGQLWALAKWARAPMITREAITRRMSAGGQRLENFCSRIAWVCACVFQGRTYHGKVYQDIDVGSGVTSALAPEHLLCCAAACVAARVTTTTQRYPHNGGDDAVFELFFSVFVDISHRSTLRPSPFFFAVIFLLVK